MGSSQFGRYYTLHSGVVMNITEVSIRFDAASLSVVQQALLALQLSAQATAASIQAQVQQHLDAAQKVEIHKKANGIHEPLMQ